MSYGDSVDPAKLAEDAARQDEAWRHVITLLEAGELAQARREAEALKASEAAARREAEAAETALTKADGARALALRKLEELDPVRAAGVWPMRDFVGRKLPEPVLWGDSRRGGGTVIRVGDVAALGGAGGVGKSFVSLSLAVATASGYTHACGLHVRGGGAVILSYEDDPETMAWRTGLIATRGGETGEIPENLHIVPDPNPLMTADHDRPGKVHEADNWRKLWDGIAGRNPSLVIVDPASAALAGVNQNDGATVRRFIRALAHEGASGGFGVLIVAHSTKAARFGAIDPGPGVLAGSGQWWDACRSVLWMRGDGPNRAVIECRKANHGPSGWAVTLEADNREQPGKTPMFCGWLGRKLHDPESWATLRKAHTRKPAKKNGVGKKAFAWEGEV